MTDRKSSTAAKMRWKLLAKALQEGHVQESDISVRKFSSFKLINFIPITSSVLPTPRGAKWYECTCSEDPLFKLCIRLLSKKITIEGLKGFDNTGNICIWPSEEVLSYYCMKNKEMFSGQSVCELGGGMTCLAGLAVAATTDAKEVYLTDGNNRSIQNTKTIVEKNIESFGKTAVISRLLRWDNEQDIKELKAHFDIIICADCCYLEAGRLHLVTTIVETLKDNGLAVVLAPSRGHSLKKFEELAKQRLSIDKLMVYDTHVWDLHVKLKEEDVYDEDLHYPQMLILRKSPPESEVKPT